MSRRACGSAFFAMLLAAAAGARAGVRRPTLAVIGFAAEAGDAQGARASEILCDLLEVAFSADGELELVERGRIDRILRELTLSRSGLVSRQDVLRIGRLAKADFLLYGSIGTREGTWFIEARLVEARTGKIRRSFSRELRAGSEPVVAGELARAVILTVRRDRPGPRLAVLPFCQTRGFDRLLHLQTQLRDLLVEDFQKLGTFFVLEREDMKALTDEVELSRSGLTPGGAGPDYEREAWYLLSGDYEEVTIDGEAGMKLQVILMAVGRGGGPKLTIERRVSELHEVRREIVRWVSKRASVRRPFRYGDGNTEFDWLLDRAVSFLSRVRGISLPRMPGIKAPQHSSSWSRPATVSYSDGPAYDALVEAARNTLECAAFIRPGDERVKLLLEKCPRPARHRVRAKRKPEARARAGVTVVKAGRLEKTAAATGRLLVERHSLPSGYDDVDQIRFDGRHAWVLCFRGSSRHRGSSRGASACVYRLNLRTGEVARLDQPGRRPSSIAVSPRHLWVGTFGDGLWQMDRAAGAWTRYGEEEGLPFDYITALDWRDGRLYIGFGRGERGGIAKMDEAGRFTLLRDDERADAWRSPGMMRGLCSWYVWNRRWKQPEGWVFKVRATPQGLLARVGGEKWLVFYNEEHGAWGCLGFSTMGRGVGMDPGSGLIWCRGEHWKEKAEVYEFYEPASVGRWKWKQAGTFRRGEDPSIPMPQAAARFAGKIWFVAGSVGHLHSSGLYSYDPESLELTIYGPQDGLDFGRANVVVAREDGLWVGAATGLYRVEPSGEAEGTALKRGVDLNEVAKKEPIVRDEARFSAAIRQLSQMVTVPGLDRTPEPERSAVIVKAAGHLDDVRAVPHLIAVLSEGPDDLQEPACRALARMWKYSLSDLVKANRELKYPTSSLPLRAIRSIIDPRAAPRLARLASETGSGYVRRAARAAMFKMGPEAAEALAPHVRERWAADALVKLGPLSLEHLVPLLSEERRTASGARAVLLKIGEPAVPALIECMRTGTRQARAHATSTLRRIREAEESLVRLLSYPDPMVRCAAADALTYAKLPSTVEVLITLADDRVADVRARVADTLGDLKDERAVECLARLLGDESVNVRNSAASALAEIGAGALDVLLEEMRHPSAERRARAVGYLGSADWAPLEQISEAISDPNPRVRLSVVSSLGRSRDPWTLPCLLKALDDPDEGVSATAASSLARNFADNVKVIRKLFTSGNEKIRRTAARAVFERLPRSSIYRPPLEMMDMALRDESKEVRRLAAKALARTEEKGALPLVLKALSDPDRYVRENVTRSRLLSAPEARATLLEALDDESGIVRMRASSFLSHSPPPDTLETFLKLLQSDPKKGVRRYAAQALGRLGGLKAVKALIHALGDEDKDVRRTAAEALGNIADPAAVAPIIEALGDEEVIVKVKAAEALGRIRQAGAMSERDGAKAVEALIRALRDGSSSVRISAAISLGKIGGPDARRALSEALERETDERVRNVLVRRIKYIEDSVEKEGARP